MASSQSSRNNGLARLLEQLSQKYPQAYGAGYGSITGLLGGIGELEHLGAYDLPELVGARDANVPKDKIFGRETVFPTTENVQGYLDKYLDVPAPPPEAETAQFIGELAGPFGLAKLAKPVTRLAKRASKKETVKKFPTKEAIDNEELSAANQGFSKGGSVSKNKKNKKKQSKIKEKKKLSGSIVERNPYKTKQRFI